MVIRLTHLWWGTVKKRIEALKKEKHRGIEKIGCMWMPSWWLLGIVCGWEKNRYMLSNSHGGSFNMGVCCSCGGNHARHTASAVEKQSEPKKQRGLQPFLWCTINHHTHIKNADKTTKHITVRNKKMIWNPEFATLLKIAKWALTYILVYVFSLLLQLSNRMLIS